MKVEVWSDIVCPWCYVGAVRLRKAIAQLDRPEEVELRTRAFRLDPFASEVPRPTTEYLAEKYATSLEQAAQMDGRLKELAAEEGVPYVSPRPVANSFKLHRMVYLAREFDAGEALFERLQHLHFGEGVDVYSAELLAREAAALGVPEARAADLLVSDEFTAEVEADEAEARQLGVTGVPFAVLARKYAIPGAVATDQYLAALKEIS